MAGRKSTQAEATPESVETTTDEAVETPTPEVATEAAEANEAAATEASEAPKAEAEVDLTAFKNVVSQALQNYDSETGSVTDEAKTEIVAQYRALSGTKGKSAGRAELKAEMLRQMDAKDVFKARAVMDLQKAIDEAPSGGGKRASATPVDPTQAHVELVAGLRTALDLAQVNLPEGVNEDWATKAKELVSVSAPQAEQYRAWVTSTADDKGDEPDVPAFVKSAVKLSLGKSARVSAARASSGTTRTPFDGPRRNVKTHLASAIAAAESGTFLTVADLVSHKSAEYGDDSPSSGAVSARIEKEGFTIDGATFGTDEKNRKGLLVS